MASVVYLIEVKKSRQWNVFDHNDVFDGKKLTNFLLLLVATCYFIHQAVARTNNGLQWNFISLDVHFRKVKHQSIDAGAVAVRRQHNKMIRLNAASTMG